HRDRAPSIRNPPPPVRRETAATRSDAGRWQTRCPRNQALNLAVCSWLVSRFNSEFELPAKLNDSSGPGQGQNSAESGGCHVVRWIRKIGSVRQIEEFETQLQLFLLRNRYVFEDRQIHIHPAGPNQGIAPTVAECPHGIRRVSAGVEVCLQIIVSQTARRKIGVSHHIRAIASALQRIIPA